ncbi:MAG: TolC family protein [Betaproteobacteria bacterium]
MASYDRSRSTTRVSGALSGGSAPVNTTTGSVTLSQTIYDFGKTSSSVDISKYNLESSRSDLTTTEDTVILNVKQAYYGVLQAKRNRDVAADVIKQFQLHLEQAKGFYDVGTKAKIDVIKAEVDLSNAQLSLINAENALKIAQVTLNNTMGTPDAPEYAIEDNLSFQKYTITLEEATARAFENRPDLKSAIAKRQAAEENISLQRSGYYPVLTGNAGYSKIEQDVPNNTTTDNWDVGVTLTFPLFSGFLTSHQVAEAKSNLYILQANEESLRQQILLEVRQAYLNLQAAEASISTAELATTQAKENLDLANGRYAAGVGSPVEVSDAFATYVTAQANYTSALANYKIAQASIEKAMGAR